MVASKVSIDVEDFRSPNMISIILPFDSSGNGILVLEPFHIVHTSTVALGTLWFQSNVCISAMPGFSYRSLTPPMPLSSSANLCAPSFYIMLSL
jgi:hypothetical protein